MSRNPTAVANERAPLRWRPIHPLDATALVALYDGLSPADRRRRFHGAVAGLSALAVQRMTAQRDTSELAFVVTAGTDGALIADARCVVDASGDGAEFALVVAPAWRCQGVGRFCLDGLCRAASARGLRWLYGSVLADNLPMLALLRRCGFFCSANHHDERLVQAERLLPGFLHHT